MIAIVPFLVVHYAMYCNCVKISLYDITREMEFIIATLPCTKEVSCGSIILYIQEKKKKDMKREAKPS